MGYYEFADIQLDVHKSARLSLIAAENFTPFVSERINNPRRGRHALEDVKLRGSRIAPEAPIAQRRIGVPLEETEWASRAESPLLDLFAEVGYDEVIRSESLEASATVNTRLTPIKCRVFASYRA